MSSVPVLLAADTMSMSSGRLLASLAGILGLAGVILGVRALRRRGGALVALVVGLLSMAVGGVVVGTADGGVGGGNGLGGAYVALVLGLTAAVLGGLALARRRTATGSRV